MKNKAPLALMEQMVMLLVFALAAALCLQVFVLSDWISLCCEARDHAVTAVQNTAEILKSYAGDTEACEALLGGTGDDSLWQIGYDSDWRQVPPEQAEYQILVTPVQTDSPLLGAAAVSAQTAEGDLLFQVTVSWQEVAHG